MWRLRRSRLQPFTKRLKSLNWLDQEKTMDFDIEVAGTGFYSIQGRSEEGAAWVRKNVQDSDPQGLAYTDDSRLALEIVKGASNDGLSVSIDGRKYTE